MNPWLERALIGAVGSAASTAVWFGSAKNRDGTPRRRRRKRKKPEKSLDDDNHEGEQMAKSEDAPAKKKSSAKDKPPASGTTASRDLKDFEGGMSTAEFKENLSDAAKGVTGFFRGLVRRDKSQDAAPSEQDAADADDSAQRSSSPSADTPKRRRKKSRTRRKKKDGLAQLKEEAVYMATSAVKKKVVEGTGIDKAADAIKDGAESLKDNLVEGGQALSEKIKSAVPENLGDKMTDARESVTDAYEKVAERVRAEVSEGGDLSEKMEGGLRDLGRWIQGPGAQEEEKKPPPKDLLAAPERLGDPGPHDTGPSSFDSRDVGSRDIGSRDVDSHEVGSTNVVEAKLSDDELPRDLPR